MGNSFNKEGELVPCSFNLYTGTQIQIVPYLSTTYNNIIVPYLSTTYNNTTVIINLAFLFV